jgi:hypothetical protein
MGHSLAEQFGIPASAKLGIGIEEAFAYLGHAQENKTIKKEKKASTAAVVTFKTVLRPVSYLLLLSVSCMIVSSVTFHDSYLIKTAIKTTTH